MNRIKLLTAEENIKFSLDAISDRIIPFALNAVIKWGCQKTEFETFADYIDKTAQKSNQKWVKENKRNGKLKQHKTDDFDTSALYSLIPAVCENILTPGTEEWADKVSKDKTCVEYLLKKVKDIRNIKAHNDIARMKVINLTADVEIPLCELLQAAGVLYSKSKAQIDCEICKLKEMFKELDQSGIDFIRNNFVKEGRNEMKEYWNSKRKNVNLTSGTSDLLRSKVFYNGTISYKKGPMQDTVCRVPTNTLLEEIDSNFILLQGDPGMGKSTLLKMIVDDWVGINSSDVSFHTEDKYDLLVFWECSQKIPKTFMQFLRTVFPKTLASMNLPDDVLLNSLSHLRILFLVDGYDECSIKYKENIQDLIQISKNHTNQTFLISSRPFGSQDLVSYLSKISISHKIAAMEALDSFAKQVTFLEKYEIEMFQQKSSKLLQTFHFLPKDVKKILTTPLLLAMFCCIFASDESLVSKWKSEWHMFDSFKRFVVAEMTTRAGNLVNSKILINRLMDELGKLSLQQLLQSCSELNEKTYERFCEKCIEKISKDVPYDSVLSSVLIMRTSIDKLKKTWIFFHASFQEFLAATSIGTEIEKQEEDMQDGTNAIDVILKKFSCYDDPQSSDRYDSYFNLLIFIIFIDFLQWLETS